MTAPSVRRVRNSANADPCDCDRPRPIDPVGKGLPAKMIARPGGLPRFAGRARSFRAARPRRGSRHAAAGAGSSGSVSIRGPAQARQHQAASPLRELPDGGRTLHRPIDGQGRRRADPGRRHGRARRPHPPRRSVRWPRTKAGTRVPDRHDAGPDARRARTGFRAPSACPTSSARGARATSASDMSSAARFNSSTVRFDRASTSPAPVPAIDRQKPGIGIGAHLREDRVAEPPAPRGPPGTAATTCPRPARPRRSGPHR